MFYCLIVGSSNLSFQGKTDGTYTHGGHSLEESSYRYFPLLIERNSYYQSTRRLLLRINGEKYMADYGCYALIILAFLQWIVPIPTEKFTFDNLVNSFRIIF